MPPLPDLDQLVRKFDGPGVNALVLTGSHARGTAGVFSDIDLIRYIEQAAVLSPSAGDGSYLIEGILVTIASVTAARIEDWFSRPEVAVTVIAGLRTARPLLDRGDTFAAVRRRAQAFVWDAAMQQKANHWAGQQMVDLIEDAHKGLEGLRRDDTGRLLNSRVSCSWLLTRLVGVQRGVLLTSDNGFYDEIGAAVGPDSEWVRLRRTAFGIGAPAGKGPSLREQVIAGLRLYVATARLLRSAIDPPQWDLVELTIARIESELGRE
jgi:predicted nucleotidyltransferase